MNWQDEADAITEMAADRNIDPALPAAIRRTENGRPGREFGILSEKAPTYAEQLDACGATIVDALIDFPGNPLNRQTNPDGLWRTIYSTEFLQYLARRYAPIGAGNDPEGLNRNWLNDVANLYHHMLTIGLTDPSWSDLTSEQPDAAP